MLIIGIDPGVEPYMAVLEADGDGSVVRRVNTFKAVREQSVHGDSFAEPLLERLRQEQERDSVVACVERVGAMPGQGIASTAKFCMSFGMIRGILHGLGVPYTLVVPTKWKRELFGEDNLGNDLPKAERKKHQKALAAQFVHGAYPSVNLIRKGCRTEDHNAAEAICLATWKLRFAL